MSNEVVELVKRAFSHTPPPPPHANLYLATSIFFYASLWLDHDFKGFSREIYFENKSIMLKTMAYSRKDYLQPTLLNQVERIAASLFQYIFLFKEIVSLHLFRLYCKNHQLLSAIVSICKGN